MTEVQKVSIGGYAFTLEVEAYTLVKQYLDELNEHYSQREGGAEVMEGFEERMAELLYEKCADDGVASVQEINEIIAVLGKPGDIESEDDPEPVKASDKSGTKSERPREKKRLYRNPKGKILGGVCNGLAAYFKIDVVLVRIIFIALAVLGLVLGDRFDWSSFPLTMFAFVAYLILWISMPEAKTVQQRWEMGVTNPPVNQKPAGSELGRVLRILIGCLLMLIGVAGMTSGLAVLFGQNIFDWNIFEELTVSGDIDELLPLMNSTFFKVDMLLLYFLPFIGMTYGGVMMAFDLKSPSWRPGLIVFLLWVAALVALIVMGAMAMYSSL